MLILYCKTWAKEPFLITIANFKDMNKNMILKLTSKEMQFLHALRYQVIRTCFKQGHRLLNNTRFG